MHKFLSWLFRFYCSLLLSLSLLPAHLKYLKLRHEKGEPSRLERLQQRFADGFERNNEVLPTIIESSFKE